MFLKILFEQKKLKVLDIFEEESAIFVKTRMFLKIFVQYLP